MMASGLKAVVRPVAERLLGGSTRGWKLLSTSHSTVWRVECGGEWVVKVLRDSTSDAYAERDLMAALGWPLARPISHLHRLNETSVLVIAPYLEGELLADWMASCVAGDREANALASSFDALLTAVAARGPYGSGYGRWGSGSRSHHLRWSEALRGYLDEQRIKGPRTAAAKHQVLAATLDKLAERLDAECGRPKLIPTDVNGRNFIVSRNAETVTALNFPVLWHGDPAMPYGILQLHLDDTLIASELLHRQNWPRWRIHFYAMYHAFVISVYVERFGREGIETAAPWGRRRALFELFDLHLRHLQEEICR